MQQMQNPVEGLKARRKRLRGFLDKKDICLAVCVKEGILLMVVNDNRRNRIYQVYDRIALVGNREPDVKKIACNLATLADLEGHNLSAGDVSVVDRVDEASDILWRSFSDYWHSPLVAELILAELAPILEKDTLTHIPFYGINTRESSTFLFIGGKKVELDERDEEDYEEDEGPATDKNSLVKNYLDEHYDKEMSLKDLASGLFPILKEDDKRVEIAILERKGVEAREFNKVFQRINLKDWRLA